MSDEPDAINRTLNHAGEAIGVGVIRLSARRGWEVRAHPPALHAERGWKVRAVAGSSWESAWAAAHWCGLAPRCWDSAHTDRPDVQRVVVAGKVSDHHRCAIERDHRLLRYHLSDGEHRVPRIVEAVRLHRLLDLVQQSANESKRRTSTVKVGA